MTSQINDQHDLTAEIFGVTEYLPAQAEPKQFKPWHKPRKHFVRSRQLLVLLERLYEKRQPEEPLRYLGLPGTDLIDLRYLYQELCHPQNRPLRFLGFNTEARPGSSAHIELSISLDEVHQLPRVDPRSDVIHDDFRRIGNEASIAWERVQAMGPYDIVNIDLCDSLASDPPQDKGTIYDALARLVALQSRNHTPWLLLITTRIGRGMFNLEAEQEFMEIFRKNARECDGFIETCQQCLDLDALAVDPAMCSETDLLQLMTAAISMWLSTLVQAQAASDVNLASTHTYQVEPTAACEDMVSLALRFEPVIAASQNALFPDAPPPVDECDIAEHILKRTAKSQNVDRILKESPPLYQELIHEMKRLLAAARYDVSQYQAWLCT